MRMQREDCLCVVIDQQEKLMPVIEGGQEVVQRTDVLLRGLQALGVPALVTRQYPKGLGDTVPALAEAAQGLAVHDKLAFSIMGEPEIRQAIADTGKKTVLICGAEAHICVLQSVIDLLAEGYQVALLADAIGSRCRADKKIALRRAQQEGAMLSSVESILFELTERAGSDTFKIISKLIK